MLLIAKVGNMQNTEPLLQLSTPIHQAYSVPRLKSNFQCNPVSSTSNHFIEHGLKTKNITVTSLSSNKSKTM